MKKRSIQPKQSLTLNRETIAQLTDRDATQVVGAMPNSRICTRSELSCVDCG